jgi:glycosyltransferase involved in cell wall biosynthesis
MAETTRLIFNTLLQKYPKHYEIHQIGLKHVYAVTTANWQIHATKTIKSSDGRIGLDKQDVAGQKTIRILLPTLEPDIVFAFNDPQHLDHLCIDATQRKHKLILYVNFDGFPVPPLFDYLFKADCVVTSTDFSRRAFLASHRHNEAEKVKFMYSPADIARFAPISDFERTELRRDLFPSWMPPTAFVLGWVGLNQWRKQVWVLYQVIHLLRTGRYHLCPDCGWTRLIDSQASTEFPMSGVPTGFDTCISNSCPRCGSCGVQQAEPIRDIFLWLHMPKDSRQNIWPVDLLQKLYDIQPGRDIHYTDSCCAGGHLAPADMPILYHLWDGLLYLSGGEGFGLPAWEAMCSGIPIIYTNYSSHAEFVRLPGAGLPVGGRLQPEPGTCILRLLADVAEALEAVRNLYFHREIGTALGRRGRAFAEQHSTEVQAARWHRLFQEISCSSTITAASGST